MTLPFSYLFQFTSSKFFISKLDLGMNLMSFISNDISKYGLRLSTLIAREHKNDDYLNNFFPENVILNKVNYISF